MASHPMTPHDKVNILLVDDQPSKLLTYEVILREPRLCPAAACEPSWSRWV